MRKVKYRTQRQRDKEAKQYAARIARGFELLDSNTKR
jgi:hypothetical protein